jgi:hypothetical protein
MWGKLGDWSVSKVKYDVDLRVYYAFRRLVRAYAVGRARSWLQEAPDRRDALRRLRMARRMLRCSDRTFSDVRGVSAWMPGNLIERFLASQMEGGRMVRDWDLRREVPEWLGELAKETVLS